MFSLLLRYKSELISSEGGLWLVLIDALLVIPLIMAAFFYPLQVLLGVVIVAGVTLLAAEGLALWRRHRLRT